jgi:HEAT repeat protein
MPLSDEVRVTILSLNDDESWIREESRERLRELWPSHMDEIVDVLDSSDVKIRRAAARAICELGLIATKARPKVRDILVQTLEDSDIWVRYNACWAVLEISVEDVPYVYVADGPDEPRPVCVDDERSVLALCKCTNDPQWNVRQAAVQILGEIGRGYSQVTSAIIERSKDVHENVRFFVPDALAQLGTWDAAVEACLMRLLQEKDANVRAYAVKAVRHLSPKDEQSNLLECMRNDKADQVQKSLRGVFDDCL